MQPANPPLGDEPEELVKELATAKSSNPEEALVALSIICQKDGTSKRTVGSVYAIVNGKTFTLDDVGRVISSTNSLKKNIAPTMVKNKWNYY